MIKTNSLRFRLTVMTGIILLLCSIALTLSASYNAGKQFAAAADTVSSDVKIVLTPDAEDNIAAHAPTVGTAQVMTAQRNFDLGSVHTKKESDIMKEWNYKKNSMSK